MKRTALKRKTPMNRGKPMAKKSKTKREARDGDPAYLDFVRTLPCCACGYSRELSHPHHAIGRMKGMGAKVHDRLTMPLCWACHRAIHDGKGIFEYMTRSTKNLWQDDAIAATQALHEEHVLARLEQLARAL